MNILGIETSCDETSASVVKDGRTILSNIIASQVDFHRNFGGVVPEIASRKHLELINPVIHKALVDSGLTFDSIDGVAVTNGPGLIGSLVIGLCAAKAISYIYNISLIGINHLEAHIYANFLEFGDFKFPVICLIVSGGHTDLILMRGHGKYDVLGRTRDDAAGEALDKIGREMNLPYPAGPIIDELSKSGNPDCINFPRAYIEGSLDFSFSGVKTSAARFIKSKRGNLNLNDFASSYLQAIVDVLVKKTIDAAQRYDVKRVLIAGGVASNSRLRQCLKKEAEDKNIEIFFPKPQLCTDNAVMIACNGYYKLINGRIDDLTLDAVAGLEF